MSLETSTDWRREQRVLGALVGSVVGDALGAPFEFGGPGQFSRRFRSPALGLATEMCGGGALEWRPGEWTDDTQMALHLAYSLLDHDGIDEADVFDRWRRWCASDLKDAGMSTRAVLGSGEGWERAAQTYYDRCGQAAGNGSLMRTTPTAIYFSRRDPAVTVDAARRLSALTHADPAAGDGCAAYHLMVAAALRGENPLDVIDDALAEMSQESRRRWGRVLADSWQPADATESNGAVWPTLGTAVWALRSGLPFADAMRAVIALGGDTDTVACVTGGLLGATYGIEAIPGRWSSALMGDVPASEICPAGIADLQQLAARLDGAVPSPEPVPGVGIDAMEVEPGLWLSDLEGAVRASGDLVVLSLCRTFGRLRQANQRQFYLVDSDGNLTPETVLREVVDTIDAVRAEGHPVLVHCYGGASRTGLVLRAWLRRSRGLSADAANAEATRLWPHTARWNTSFDQVLEEFS